MNPLTSFFNNQSSDSEKVHNRLIRRKVLGRMGMGVVVVSIPIGVWWYWSSKERKQVQDQSVAVKERREQLPISLQSASQDTYDYIIATKCLPGDVLLFDRRCERCCSSPWAALSCIVSKKLLCNLHTKDDNFVRSIDYGSYDHIGLIVPGYVTKKSDQYDPTNLLVLEATPSGIVARNLKERLEQTASRSVLLLQLNCPGEERNKFDSDIIEDDEKTTSKKGDNNNATTSSSSSRQLAVQRTREYMEKELCNFRDIWIEASLKRNYANIHSTVVLGGALAYGLGLTDYIAGPVSPSAYLTLSGLQKAAAAPSFNDIDNRKIKVEDYLRDYRFQEQNAVRLRPGWRFLSPIPIKDSTRM